MRDLLKVGLPALIALLGTILTAFLGYRQWKKTQQASRQANFLQEKQQTYKALWEMVENVHVHLRTKEAEPKQFREMLTEVNSFILQKSIYLDPDIHQWTNEYLNCVRDLKAAVAASGNPAAQQDFAVTAIGLPADSPSLRELAVLMEKTTDFRDRILGRCRDVLAGKGTRLP